MKRVNDSTIHLKLTGPLERLAGRADVYIPCVGESPLSTVLAQLVGECPQASRYLGEPAGLLKPEGCLPPGVLVIRQGIALPARLETPVSAGEQLTIMPMISGG